MRHNETKFVGFTCAYTPLPLIHAAGFTPYRIFPLGDATEQAGSLLHDNLCPHVKRSLDRALAGDLPELAGVVFMDSCESMRRLADAWQRVFPADRQALVPLPPHEDEAGVGYLATQLKLLADTLSHWAGRDLMTDALVESLLLYDRLARRLAAADQLAARGKISRSAFQEVLNRSVTQPMAQMLEVLEEIEEQSPAFGANSRVPVVLFGNVLPDPEALALFESSGLSIVNADTCTGARQYTRYRSTAQDHPFVQMARAMLARPVCARSVEPETPGALAGQVTASVRQTGAKGVVLHVMKFCDPYLGRIPTVQQILKAERIPSLVLEGDCTMRSFGQHRTRIEAFAEMLSF